MTNRLIKFRVWNEYINEFGFVAGPNDFKYWSSGYGDNPDSVWPQHLNQFTGLLDKNGKEIYEGDIIRSFSMLSGESTAVFQGVVTYKDDSFIIDGKSIHILFSAHCNLMLNLENKEIVGNIYENPELLNRN
jgi:uncharacterized phage protein (TIGR01671 family)